MYEVPVVVEERVRGGGRDLLYATAAAVILVRDQKYAVRGHGDELRRGIVGVRPQTTVYHVAERIATAALAFR